tara:strand:- start:43 stop:2625 length:2583 start_codon:yes stop_codon:yes gene_type:complete
MSNLARIEEAFMQADALAQQGDAQAQQDAALFAQEIRRLRAEDTGGFTNNMAQLNRGIAQTVGGLVDFINPFDKDTGSAATGLENVMEATGINVADRAPEGFVENVFSGAGQAAGAVLPVTKLAQVGQQLPGLAGRVFQTAAPQLSTTGAFAGELAAGGLSQGASEVAEQQGYGETGQAIAALAGGLSPALAAPAVRTAYQQARKVPQIRAVTDRAARELLPFSPEGRRVLASERMRAVAGGDEAARAAAENLGAPNPLALTPAEQTGNPNIIALQRAATDKDPVLRTQTELRQAESERLAREQLTFGGRVEDAQDFVAQRAAASSRTLEEYVEAARVSAQNKIPRGAMDSVEASTIVARELGLAEDLARAEQRRLWGRIPKAVELDVSAVRQTIKELKNSITRYTKSDIPSAANKFLKATKKTGMDRVDEVNALYSAMRDTARNAVSGTVNKNEARIANEIADSVLRALDAIPATTDVNRRVIEARTFSREMHNTFSRGAVGKLLKRTSRGELATPEELTLQRSIRSGGDTGALAQRDIATAVRGTEGEAPVANATENYLRENFMTKAFSGKSFQPSAAANFVRDNKRLLDEFPTVRQEIDQSIASQQRLGAVETRAPRIAAAAAKSPAAKFAAASADKALDQIVAAARPQRAAANLRATALKDPTGAAIDGLKKAVSKALINRSALLLPHVDAAGAISQLRGTRLAETLDDEAFSAVAKQFLNSSELSRTRMVVREVQKLDLGRLMRSDPETLKRFEPNTVLETAVRILGANFGAMASGSAGGSFQAANIMSARFKSVLGALTNNQAQGLVLEALTADPDVMRMLLLDLRPPENLARIRRKLLPLLTGTATATATEDN